MLGTFKQRCAAVVCGLLATAALGVPSIALAEGVDTYEANEAMLTKVIVAPADTDASSDTYKFHFAGGGVVADGDAQAGQDRDKIYSGGIEQDKTTLKIGDVVPTIEDVTLSGVELTSSNTLTDGQLSQVVVQKSIASILRDNKVGDFPHAGVYVYEVTESYAHTALTDGTYINASQAQYTLRIYVTNEKIADDSELGDRGLVVDKVTIEQTKNDNGDDPKTNPQTEDGKVDPTYPKATEGKITYTADGVTPAEHKLAGDERGRDVEGFTFANEYIKGGSFEVKKLYDGPHSDRTAYSTVELLVYSKAATEENAQGCCLTYQIEGEGIDLTPSNVDSEGARTKLTGVEDIPQTNHYMVRFTDDGWAYIKANLKEDSVIRITGEFGPFNPEYVGENGKDKRKTLSTSGLLVGQDFYVIERSPGDYRPTAYIYVGDDGDTVDPRDPDTVADTDMIATSWVDVETPDPTPALILDAPAGTNPANINRIIDPFGVCATAQATGGATTVFVVNTIDENKVSPTGILINNLPYILMVGVPLAAFAVMFVSRRRKAQAA